MSNSVLTRLTETLQPYFSRPIWLAFSGGLDSTVLCHATAQLAKHQPLSIRILHINHQLHADADIWAKHCEMTAKTWHLPFEAITITTQPEGGSLENWARQQRRQIFAEKLAAGGVVVTAHHRDDQAETLLFRLMRGTGPDGLAAMREYSPLAQGQVVRPFLTLSRDALSVYAKQQDLTWVDDPSNQETIFARNYLRHEVMPRLQKQWPQVETRLVRCADLCAQQRSLLEAYLQQELIPLLDNGMANQLSIIAWQALPAIKQGPVLRHWLYQQTGLYVSYTQIQQIIQNVILARADAKPLYQLGRWQCRRYRQVIYLCPDMVPIDSAWSQVWDGEAPLEIPGWSEPLTKRRFQEYGVEIDTIDWSQVEVRFRRQGERAKPKGRGHSQTLKKLFQEYQVPPWLRARIPLIFVRGKLVAALGIFIC